jgi:hypothetical protein
MNRRIVLEDDEICPVVNETAGQLMAKTLSMMDTDPEVQQAMREQVLKMITASIGKTVRDTRHSSD